MKTSFFHDEKCLWHIGQLHAGVFPVGGWVQPPNSGGLAESPDSKRRLISLLEVSGLAANLQIHSAPLADEAYIRKVHPASYLQTFKTLSDGEGGRIGNQATFGPGGYEIARLSAGLTIDAVDSVLRGAARNSYALSRPPGHHCLPDEGMGFCLLANGAIAVEAAISRHKLSRVAILDWDVHHGNGTERIFIDRPDVFTISLHQENCFPLSSGGVKDRGVDKGEGYNLNIPLLPGGGEQSYQDAFDLLVGPALRSYRPELIVVACGYDASGLDPLARMLLPSEAFRWMMAQVMQIADEVCQGRVSVIHEGGYSECYVPFCGHALMEQLSGFKTEVIDPSLEFIRGQQPEARFTALQRKLLEEQAAAHKFTATRREV